MPVKASAMRATPAVAAKGPERPYPLTESCTRPGLRSRSTSNPRPQPSMVPVR